MSSFGKYTKESFIHYAEQIDIKGARLGRTNDERRNKFYEGIPESFSAVIAYERMLLVGNYVYPANFVAHDPRAGNPHPFDGQPDIMACARAFQPEWECMIIKGLIKRAPRGSVQALNHDSSSEGESDDECPYSDDESDNNESANMARAAINSRTVCLECGGLGHAADIDNGKIKCPNILLKTKVERSTLEKIVYPDGITRPTFNRKSNFNNSKKQADYKKKQAQSVDNESSNDEANFTRGKKKKKHFPKRKKLVKIAQPEEVNEESDNDEQSDEHNEEAGSSMLINDESSDNEDVKKLIEQYLNWEKRMKESKKVKGSKKVNNISSSDDNGNQNELAVSFDNLRI